MKSIILFAFLFFIVCYRQVTGQITSQSTANQNPYPLISDIVSALDKDSLAAHMQRLVNMGTRFMYAENRRQVASVIASKFRSYGYTDVMLDSFKVPGETVSADSVWQYNVVASLAGSSAPGEIYIISAHHDNYRADDPHLQIPGADDNGSGCAVVLEIARVLKLKGFQPASTIRFVTYAAEELIGHTGISGSVWYAEKIRERGEDLRLDINNDMVAYVKDSTNSLIGTVIPGSGNGWAGDLTLACAGIYAPTLNIIPGPFPTSDSYWFYKLGYPVGGFEEFGLNPTYHTVNDSVSKCNMDICLDVARASCAILLSEQLTPVPQKTYCFRGTSSVKLFWKSTANDVVKGFSIYRSNACDSVFTRIGQADARDSCYTDTTAQAGTLYYYYVKSFDNQQYESVHSDISSGALFPQDKELLVVKDTKGGFNNPSDSAVMESYRQIFQNFDYDLSDASVADSMNLNTLGRYKRVFWLSNSYSNMQNSSFRRNYKDVTAYLQSGGQLFIAGCQPTFMISGNISVNESFFPADTIQKFYKIRAVLREPAALLNRASPSENEYDTIHIDPEKCPPQTEGYIINLECIYPASDAKIIYRYNSGYDTNTVQGKMNGKPVGIEYLGDDFKLIVTSVPLYYMDSLEAKSLADLVINRKFISHVGIEDQKHPENKSLLLRSFPNPFQDKTTISFYLAERGPVRLMVFNVAGEKILSCDKGWMDAGLHSISIDTESFHRGMYIVNMVSGKFSGSVTILRD